MNLFRVFTSVSVATVLLSACGPATSAPSRLSSLDNGKPSLCEKDFLLNYEGIFENASKMFEAEKYGTRAEFKSAVEATVEACTRLQQIHPNEKCTAVLKNGSTKLLSSSDEMVQGYCENARAKRSL